MAIYALAVSYTALWRRHAFVLHDAWSVGEIKTLKTYRIGRSFLQEMYEVLLSSTRWKLSQQLYTLCRNFVRFENLQDLWTTSCYHVGAGRTLRFNDRSNVIPGRCYYTSLVIQIVDVKKVDVITEGRFGEDVSP